MIKFTKASESEELFARWREIFLVNRGKEGLDLAAHFSYYKAAEAILGNVLVGHVQFIYKLAAMWSKLIATVL